MSIRFLFGCFILLAGLGALGAAGLSAYGIAPKTVIAALSNAAPRSFSDGGTPKERPVDSVEIEAVWRAWMAKYEVTKSSIAIGHKGDILHSTGVKRDASRGYQIASLSKAITAICFNEFLAKSDLGWTSTLADLKTQFDRLNLTPAPEMQDLTLSHLATHTSGFPKILKYGKTSVRKRNLSSQVTMTRAALKESANFGARNAYEYSNANYAVLGVLIGALSETNYADYCKATVTDPAGAKGAVVGGRMAQTAGYGGWSVSAEDYARFAMHWFAPNQAWVIAPEEYAYHQRTGYGLGVFRQSDSWGNYYSHAGQWTHTDKNMPNIGSFFMVRPDGAVVVINWDGSLKQEAYRSLHRTLFAAL